MFKFIKKLFSKEKILVVQQDWVTKLSLLHQSSLMSILRGTDIENGTLQEAKDITKMLRYVIANDAGKKRSYMSNYVIPRNEVIKYLFKVYPNNRHWVEHVIGASYIVHQQHPDNYVRDYWGSIAKTLNYKVRGFKKKEKKRLEKELYIKSIIDKYTDIYMVRGI